MNDAPLLALRRHPSPALRSSAAPHYTAGDDDPNPVTTQPRLAKSYRLSWRGSIMMRAILPAVVLLAGTGMAMASLSSLVGAWGHDFVIPPFEPMQVMVAMATDKITGKQFNVIKMPDGHVMAVVPFDQMAKMPEIDSKSLMR
ncbi:MULTISPECIES: hypothetical protein [unclassified Methylobacterium]|uniref:hypothetical protein n=1 Tax=unclassified Methylobacterium TaxID=2615210 RepID=UPI001FCD69CB|nr:MULTISPECIES: hypothetical protein [unclassified Methylobacterium]